MRNLKLLLLSMLALGTVAVVGTASASAAPCEKVSGLGDYVLCVLEGETLVLLETSETFSLKQESGEPHTLEIPAIKITVSCTAGSGSATAEYFELTENKDLSLLVMKGTITFTTCTVVGNEEANCEVEGGKIEAKEIDAAATLAEETEGTEKANRLDLELSAEGAEGIFAVFTIKSKAGKTCLGAVSKGKVTGTELCYFLEAATGGGPIEEDSVDHLLQCVPSGLKFAAKEARFTAEFETELSGTDKGLAWSITEGV